MSRKALALILAISIGLLNPIAAYADNLKDQLELQKKQMEHQKSQLEMNQDAFDKAQQEIESINSQIEMLDSKIEKSMKDIENTNIKIEEAQQNIEIAQEELDTAIEELQKGQKLFNKRMRSMYTRGNSSYIGVILSAEDFSDFVSRMEVVTSIIKFDRKLANKLKIQKEEAENARNQLEWEKQQLVDLRTEQKARYLELEASKDEQQILIEKAEERKNYYAEQIEEFNKKIRESEILMENTIKEMKRLAEEEERKARLKAKENGTASGNNDIPTPAPNSIVAYAYEFLGTTYVWGGETPDPGFDCSGLMQYVYAHFGIKITRTTYTQIYDGIAVEREDLQPGDLIFFGTWQDPHHVGMYVGNGFYIHAPRTGDVVKISALAHRKDYLCARRILQ